MLSKCKIALLLLIMFCCLVSVNGQKRVTEQVGGWIKMSGKLIHFTNQVVVEDMSEFQYLLPSPNDRIIIPDSAGNFTIQFGLTRPGYFRIGRNILYLTPGDNLNVIIDYNNNKLASFTGIGANANLYLKDTPFPKAGSFIEAGQHIKATPALTVDTVLKIADARRKILSALTRISDEFRRLENARIQADIINSMDNGEMYSIMHLKINDSVQEQSFRKEYQLASQPVIEKYLDNFSDASFMQLAVYRDIDNLLIAKNESAAVTGKLNDWEFASSLVTKMRKVKNKKELLVLKDQISKIKTPVYRNAADKMYDLFAAFGEGDMAVNFIALSAAGENIELSSLKGKIIYVDLWATWCGPCLEEMPYFDQLKARYKDNPAVAFVSLSIDDNKDAWLKDLAHRSASGYQWQINRELLKAYSIVTIPRTLLIDKDFTMVDMDGALPSDKKLVIKIDELLQK